MLMTVHRFQQAESVQDVSLQSNYQQPTFRAHGHDQEQRQQTGSQLHQTTSATATNGGGQRQRQLLDDEDDEGEATQEVNLLDL